MHGHIFIRHTRPLVFSVTPLPHFPRFCYAKHRCCGEQRCFLWRSGVCCIVRMRIQVCDEHGRKRVCVSCTCCYYSVSSVTFLTGPKCLVSSAYFIVTSFVTFGLMDKCKKWMCNSGFTEVKSAYRREEERFGCNRLVPERRDWDEPDSKDPWDEMSLIRNLTSQTQVWTRLLLCYILVLRLQAVVILHSCHVWSVVFQNIGGVLKVILNFSDIVRGGSHQSPLTRLHKWSKIISQWLTCMGNEVEQF